MLHVLFWAWTYTIDKPRNEQNCPVYLMYAIMPIISDDVEAKASKLIASLLDEAGGDTLVRKLIAVIADSSSLDSVELEVVVDVFGHFISGTRRGYLDRLPGVLHAVQTAFSCYRVKLESPSCGYGFGGHHSDEYREVNTLIEGFNLLQYVHKIISISLTDHHFLLQRRAHWFR